MKWLNANAGTMGMSIFLAILTWVYLWSTSSATGDFAYAFKPVFRGERPASVEYTIVGGRSLHEGEALNIKVTGPRTEINALQSSTLTCTPILEPGLFSEPMGTVTIELSREDFKIRDPLRLEGQPPKITIRYVKYIMLEVPIMATADDIEGRVKPGYRVTRIVPQPDKVRVRLPADSDVATQGRAIPIQKVTVTDQSATFTAPGYLRLPRGAERLSSFDLTVVIERRIDAPRLIPNVPLRMVGPEEVLRRLTLESPKVIDIEIRGPNEVIQGLAVTDFVAYVEIDLAPTDLQPGKRAQNNLYCVLKKKVDAEIDIVIMPGVKPENRQAIVNVLPQ